MNIKWDGYNFDLESALLSLLSWCWCWWQKPFQIQYTYIYAYVCFSTWKHYQHSLIVFKQTNVTVRTRGMKIWLSCFKIWDNGGRLLTHFRRLYKRLSAGNVPSKEAEDVHIHHLDDLTMSSSFHETIHHYSKAVPRWLLPLEWGKRFLRQETSFSMHSLYTRW